jgi:hypothetical protein
MVMTTVKKEQIIRRKFRKNKYVSKVAFIYKAKVMTDIKVQVKYDESPHFESAQEHIKNIAEELDFEIKSIKYEKSSKNYEYSIFNLKLDI